MSEVFDNIYVPGPPPLGVDSAVVEWVQRELEAIHNSLHGKIGLLDMDGAWQDNLTTISAAGRATNPPVLTSIPGMTTMFGWKFSNATAPNEEQVHLNYHITHDYKRNTKVYPHVHTYISDAGDIGNVARWGFEYTIANGYDTEAFPATVTVYVESTFTAVLNHVISEVVEVDAMYKADMLPDALVKLRVFRHSSHANDTAGNNVFCDFIDLHYQMERIGTLNRNADFYAR